MTGTLPIKNVLCKYFCWNILFSYVISIFKDEAYLEFKKSNFNWWIVPISFINKMKSKVDLYCYLLWLIIYPSFFALVMFQVFPICFLLFSWRFVLFFANILDKTFLAFWSFLLFYSILPINKTKTLVLTFFRQTWSWG